MPLYDVPKPSPDTPLLSIYRAYPGRITTEDYQDRPSLVQVSIFALFISTPVHPTDILFLYLSITVLVHGRCFDYVGVEVNGGSSGTPESIAHCRLAVNFCYFKILNG